MRDYDLSETSKLIRSVYMGLAMMAFMHLYMKYVLSPPPYSSAPLSLHVCDCRPDTTLRRFTQPLFVQALMGLKNLYDAKPVAIYVLGKPAEGDLKRPFKVGGFLGGASLPSLHVISSDPDTA